MPEPTVAVGVPVYNGEAYLAECLRSLLAQTRPPDRVIIADNHSTDASLEIARGFEDGDRVHVVTAPENLGAAPNFNRLVDLASADFFAWAPADDTWTPTLLEHQLEALRDPTVVCAYGDLVYIDAASAETGRPDEVVWSDAPDALGRVQELLAADQFHSHLHVCGPVLGLVRHDVLARSGRIRPFGGSDKALIVELALHGRLRPVDAVIHRRQHPESSVVANPDEESRRRWFDPSQSGPATPEWSLLTAMLGAARRAPLRAGERRRVIAEILRWTGRNRGRRVIGGELKLLAKWQAGKRFAGRAQKSS